VRIEGLTVHGRAVASAEDAHLWLEHASGVSFAR
jgi:hypothetical protein